MPRESLPDRRAQWTQKADIGGQRFYLSFGEYEDGRLGEIFIVANLEGTFVRGVLDTLARSVSLAIQCGADLADVVKMLKGNYPPNGPVVGSPGINTCLSVTDWIAREIEDAYLTPVSEDKVAGRKEPEPPSSGGGA